MARQADIPTEILAKILQDSLPEQLDQAGRKSFQILRSVSPRWRSVAFSTPALWSSVFVVWDIRSRLFQGGFIKNLILLDAWFSRAGPSRPLDLDLLDPSTMPMRREQKEAVTALIRKYQPRWRVLSLFIHKKCIWDAIADHPPSSWAALHMLSLPAYDFNEYGVEAFDALEGMPSLRCILLEDQDAYEFERRYGGPQITDLRITLDGFGIEQARLISSYPNLSTLVLIGHPSLTSELSPDDHITLPSLSSFIYDSYELSLLNSITTPTLAELDISMRDDNNHDDELALTNFLGRRNDKALCSFKLNSHHQGTFVASILPVLSKQTALTHITLDIWPLTSKIYFPKDKTDVLCPNLRVLGVSMHQSRGVDDLEGMADLSMFLKGREEVDFAPLEKLTVRRSFGAADFPYELFENVKIGRLLVTVPF
jgi:F-box-like